MARPFTPPIEGEPNRSQEAQERMVSGLLVLLRPARPEQMPSVLLGIGFEQPGADRLRERGIVDADGEIGSGFVAGAVPSRADFDSVAEDAVVRRVLGLRADGRQDGDFGVERERADAAEKALLGQPSTVLLKRNIGVCFAI